MRHLADQRRTRSPEGVLLYVAVLIAALLLAPAQARASSAAPTSGPAAGPAPILAYYYIWFNPSSWNRAKIDYPLVGRYSSSDITVMRQQVAMAKKAGIKGFLVGWKADPTLNHRLAAIVKVALAANFKLGLVFQGLDFHRNPLPMSEVQRSFQYFASTYAKSPAFDLFGKPVVIWSGTWAYTPAQLASITQAYGSQLTILASEKQPSSYQAVASLFKGDAYYWSSVDPLTTPYYQQKLDQFAAAVHANGGLWIAPAAPGYDAKLIGGTRVVPRRNGQTLRLELNAAMRSSPDAVGLISWNEFSENTYVEPSRNYGSTALKVLAGFAGASPGAIPGFDSSAPNGSSGGIDGLLPLAGMFALLAASSLVLVVRARRDRP